MVRKDKKYGLRRDGCWLAHYYDTGIREFIDGELMIVPTGVYTSDIRYAKVFDNFTVAEALAKTMGAKVMVIG